MNSDNASKQDAAPVCVVIGATGGIGLELCRRLVATDTRRLWRAAMQTSFGFLLMS